MTMVTLLPAEFVYMFTNGDFLATWDSPPRKGTPAYAAFEVAFRHFIKARKVTVRLMPKSELQAFAKLPQDLFRKKYAFTPQSQPKLGQDKQFKLMPFQVDGVNWLCNNWWNRQHCILADEMGLVSKCILIRT